MLLSQVFIYVKFSHAYQFTYQISDWIFKILIFNSQNGEEVELPNHAKFCRNRSNRSRDMTILRFFKMADAAILDF